MTDLQAKFTHLEGLLATQQEDTLTALAPLSNIKTGVDDLVTINGDMAANFTAFASSLLSNLETISVNQTNGFRNVVNAVNALFCPCDTSGPINPVPPSTTPTPAESGALCQRIQYFIDLFRTGVLVGECVYVNSAGIMSGVSAKILQDNALTSVDITAGEIYAGMPTSVQTGVASAWNNLIAAYGPSVAQGAVFDVAADIDQWSSIRDALSRANNASDGFSEVVTAIAATEWQDGVKAIISAGFYSAWLNDIYSDVPVVDASGYNPDLCNSEPVDCFEGALSAVTDTQGNSYWAYTTALPGCTLVNPVNSSSGEVTTTPALFQAGSLEGWTILALTEDIEVSHRPGDPSSSGLFSNEPIGFSVYTFPSSGTLAIRSFSGAGTFRLCPPGAEPPS